MQAGHGSEIVNPPPYDPTGVLLNPILALPFNRNLNVPIAGLPGDPKSGLLPS